MKGKKIKEIKVLFREETKQPVSLLEYLIANDLTVDQILQDKTIEGKFMVEMKLGKEVFTWSYGFHDRDEETQPHPPVCLYHPGCALPEERCCPVPHATPAAGFPCRRAGRDRVPQTAHPEP